MEYDSPSHSIPVNGQAPQGERAAESDRKLRVFTGVKGIMDRIGVGFSGGMSPPDIVECVKLAEELGYESAWVAEGHGGDQFAILTACAVATSRIKLGTSITSVFVRTAPTIAMAAATVDHFSNGRFILGLGSSHKVQVEPEHGLEFIRPIERMRECTDIVRGILRDSDIQYRGDVYKIERFDLWFEPVRRQMPIYFAAVRPRMLEVCGEVSDGVILTWCTLDHARDRGASHFRGSEAGRQRSAGCGCDHAHSLRRVGRP